MSGTPHDRDPFTRFHSFLRGWMHGAGARPQDPSFAQNKVDVIKEEYTNGYAEGLKQRRELVSKTIERTGYKPTILRAGEADAE